MRVIRLLAAVALIGTGVILSEGLQSWCHQKLHGVTVGVPRRGSVRNAMFLVTTETRRGILFVLLPTKHGALR